MTYQEDREKTTFISPLPILTSPYLDYPELIDYIQDFETLGRKKHLLFINDADGKAEDLAVDMAFQIDGKYPYKGEGRQPKIPQVMTGLKAVGGKPMVTMEDAYKKFHFIGRCIVLFDIRRESYDSLKVSFPCLSKTEIVVFAFLKPGDDLNSLPPAFLHYCKIFDLRKRQFVERVCMERSKDTASEPQTPAGATQGKPKTVIPFPTPPGTKWHEITISCIDDEHVRISAKDVIETRHYSQMGFRDDRASKPVKSWHVLTAFSEKGCLTFPEAIKDKTEKLIQGLRKRLIAYFGIHGDPITLKDGYRPVFKCCTNERRSRSVKSFSNSDELNNGDDD